jgi:hypothetical protein
MKNIQKQLELRPRESVQQLTELFISKQFPVQETQNIPRIVQILLELKELRVEALSCLSACLFDHSQHVNASNVLDKLVLIGRGESNAVRRLCIVCMGHLAKSKHSLAQIYDHLSSILDTKSPLASTCLKTLEILTNESKALCTLVAPRLLPTLHSFIFNSNNTHSRSVSESDSEVSDCEGDWYSR